jgi:hypothetical protein
VSYGRGEEGYDSSLTDKDGYFRVGNVHAGIARIGVNIKEPLNREVTALTLKGVPIQEGEHKKIADILLVPGSVIKGRVVNRSGDPNSGAEINIVPNNEGDVVSLTQLIKTDKSGYYLIHVPPGKYSIGISSSAPTRPDPIEVKDGETREVSFGVN